MTKDVDCNTLHSSWNCIYNHAEIYFLDYLLSESHQESCKIAHNESQFLILGVVDEFLNFADLDKNGFLNFAEYVKAMNASNEDKYEEPPQSISSSDSAETYEG